MIHLKNHDVRQRAFGHISPHEGPITERRQAGYRGYAKILFSGWVRGRIPSFVKPPPKPVPKAAENTTGKDKVAEAEEIKSGLGVPQKLKDIIQKNTFVNEDVKG